MNDGHEATSLTLGHYEIIRRIGHGGMGDVYLATDSTLDRTVAIKVLPAEFSREPDFIRRFQAEATAAARLTHPNIVQIHAIGEENGRHFFVMQHVIGQSLADRLQVSPNLPLDEALVIVDQVLSGLAAAHRSGLIHRDIKPGNVLLDDEHGRALLADFGLVKSLSAVADHTATGVILGTVDYMSPEQGRGQRVDQRSDLYSVGVMLYRMLAGCLPFEADSPTAMIFQHAYETPPDLHELAPEHPPEVGALVAKLMAKEPDQRYQSADELLTALRALRREVGLVDASQIVAAPRLPTPTSDESGIGLQLPFWGRLNLLLKRRAPGLAEHLLNTQQQVDAAVSDYAERCLQLECLVADAEFVYEDLSNQAKEQRKAAVKLRQSGEAETNDSKRQAAFTEQQYCEEIADDLESQADAQQNELETIQLQFAEAKAKLLKLSNQRDLLSARLRAAQGSISDNPSRTRTLLTLPRLMGATSIAGILLSSYLIFFRSDGSEEAKKAATKSIVQKSTGDDAQDTNQLSDASLLNRRSEYIPLAKLDIGRASALAITPQYNHSGNIFVRFAVAGIDGTLRRLVFNQRKPDVVEVTRIDVQSKKVRALAFSPDRSMVAAATEDGDVQIYDYGTRRVIRTIPIAAASLKFSQDGRRLWIGAQAAIHIWNIQLNEETQRVDLGVRNGNVFGDVASMDWLAEGAIVLLGTLVEGAPGSGLWNINQREPLLVFDDVKSSGDDVHLVSQGKQAIIRTANQAQLRSLSDGSLIREFGTRGAASIALTRDRLRLITGDLAGDVEVWDLQANKLVQKITVHDEEIEHLAMSGDGSWIVAVSVSGKIAVRELLEHKPHGQIQLFRQNSAFPIPKIRVSPSGLRAATGGDRVQEWDLEFHKSHRDISNKEFNAGAVAYSRDGRRLAYSQGPERGNNNITVCAPDAARGRKVVRQFTAHQEVVTQIRFTPSGRHILSSSRDGTVIGWDGVSEEVVFHLDVGSAVNDFDVTTESRLVTADDDHRVRIWDYSKEMEIGSLVDGHTFVATSVSCSDDGTWAVSGGKDRRLIVWDLENLTKKFELLGHAAGVTSVVISNDGTKILSGCEDGIVRLWSVPERRVMREFQGHVGSVRSVDMERSGLRGMSAGDDGTVRIWDLRSE